MKEELKTTASEGVNIISKEGSDKLAITFMIEELEKRFTYHAPKGDQPEKYEALRTKGKELAMAIVDLVPDSREQSLALTYLEQAIFSANAGIARRS